MGTDAELMARVARGDGAASRELYTRFRETCLATAWRILGNKSEAEEVMQEALLEGWRRAAQFDPNRGSLGGWLQSMARSRAIDRVRSRGAAERAFAATREIEEASPPPPTPSTLAGRKRANDRISSVVATLPPQQRRVIVMAYLEGLTHREIAEQTGSPLGTVKTRARDALAAIARAWTTTRP